MDAKPRPNWVHAVIDETCRAARINGAPHGEEQKASVTVEMPVGRETFVDMPHDGGRQPEGTYHFLHECGRKR